MLSKTNLHYNECKQSLYRYVPLLFPNSVVLLIAGAQLPPNCQSNTHLLQLMYLYTDVAVKEHLSYLSHRKYLCRNPNERRSLQRSTVRHTIDILRPGRKEKNMQSTMRVRSKPPKNPIVL